MEWTVAIGVDTHKEVHVAVALDALGAHTSEQLEFLIGFLRGNVAYQEERMRRLEALKAREASAARATDRGAGTADAAEGAA